jgi:glucokinase
MSLHLVADVGGTNVRFARADASATLQDRAEFKITDFDGFGDALSAYLEQVGGEGACASAAIAGAGPAEDSAIFLTNNDWVIRADDVSPQLGGKPVALFNDLQAAALSIPALCDDDLIPVIPAAEAARPHTTRLAVNAGTGFGASALVQTPTGWQAIASEAGHMALAARNTAEFDLLKSDIFRSVEDAVSGRGLQNLYAHVAGCEPDHAPAPGRILSATTGNAAAARATDLFASLLARITGDLVLANAAWGGVYLFGSVAVNWAQTQPPDRFAVTFRDKGLMSERISQVPVSAVTRGDAPLAGLALAAAAA